jgi:hypothetical protein
LRCQQHFSDALLLPHFIAVHIRQHQVCL